MTWVSFDDGYTRERVWDGVPHDTRWHFHAIVELCCASRRYDGRLRWADALGCSDVPHPVRSVKELVTAGLLLDLGAMVEVENIDDFLPPEGQRPGNLLARKRRNQAAYRRRKCDNGKHSKDCPADCPVKAQRAAERVTARVAGNAGSGRDGTGRSPKTVGQGQSTEPTSRVRGAEGYAAGGGLTATPLQSLRDHNGSEPDGPDAQQIPIEVHLQSQATDRNAREASRVSCPVCGVRQRLRTSGKLARHGPKTTPCRGSGMTPTGTAP